MGYIEILLIRHCLKTAQGKGNFFSLIGRNHGTANCRLRQNQDLIRALQIRDDSHSHKVTVQFDKFDEENENFDSFIERFETYLDVQNVPIANRAKVFVSSLSAKLYQLLKNLLAPDIPSDQTLDKLKDALKKHLTPKPLIIPSRHKFLNRKQTEGEGISTYIAELWALAMNCDYDKDMLNIMLRDVFVSGLRDKMILDRLFEEDNINLEKTLNIALAMEKAFKGTNDIMGQAINSMQTFKKHMDKNPILQKAERKHYIVHDAQVPTMQKRIVDLFQVHVISVGKLGTLNRHASHLKRQMRNRLNKNRKFDVGDRVAVRVYRAANTRWKFGTIVNQDGVLHYIIDVQGTLVRRHVDQIRPVGIKCKKTSFHLCTRDFHHQRFEKTTLIFSMQKRRKIFLRIGTRNWVHLPYKECHQLMLRFQIYHSLQLKRLTRETRSPPVPDRPFPRRSGESGGLRRDLFFKEGGDVYI
ncbi:transposon Tf2-9 polyprotein [Trichonephila clavipes]|nr:transposon Tf2-9 polyprotein [Trichonephila clavipes]